MAECFPGVLRTAKIVRQALPPQMEQEETRLKLNVLEQKYRELKQSHSALLQQTKEDKLLVKSLKQQNQQLLAQTQSLKAVILGLSDRCRQKQYQVLDLQCKQGAVAAYEQPKRAKEPQDKPGKQGIGTADKAQMQFLREELRFKGRRVEELQRLLERERTERTRLVGFNGELMGRLGM